MNDLERYFENNNGRLIHKWMHYFEIYDRHFSRFRDREIVIMEIGVFQGGSLQMWKNYFGPKAKIIGVDINPDCKQLEEENIQIFIGSQSDRAFLRELKRQVPKVDILLDDGGHTMKQQIVSFEELFSHIKDDGVYLCEDLHTSYWLRFGGGHKRMGSFIEFSKNYIDKINAWHSEESSLKVDEFTRSAASMHYYDSILVIEKQPKEKPYDRRTGSASFNLEGPNFWKENNPTKLDLYKNKGKRGILFVINAILRLFRLPSVGW